MCRIGKKFWIKILSIHVKLAGGFGLTIFICTVCFFFIYLPLQQNHNYLKQLATFSEQVAKCVM